MRPEAIELASLLTSLGYKHSSQQAQQATHIETNNSHHLQSQSQTNLSLAQNRLPELLDYAFAVDSTRPFLEWILVAFKDQRRSSAFRSRTSKETSPLDALHLSLYNHQIEQIENSLQNQESNHDWKQRGLQHDLKSHSDTVSDLGNSRFSMKGNANVIQQKSTYVSSKTLKLQTAAATSTKSVSMNGGDQLFNERISHSGVGLFNGHEESSSNWNTEEITIGGSISAGGFDVLSESEAKAYVFDI
jgi:hypothetical protein